MMPISFYLSKNNWPAGSATNTKVRVFIDVPEEVQALINRGYHITKVVSDAP